MANIYASGQLVKLSCTFTVSGINTDPTTVVAKYRFDASATTTYTYGTDAPLVRDSTGVYHFNVTAVSAGTYYYRFQGFTACQAAEEGSFDCAVSKF